jgi:pyrroline-5-carboxylate reductase
MTDPTRFAVIGPGVMGEAIIAGLLRKGIAEPQGITAAGPRTGRDQELVERYHIRFAANSESVKNADVVILSVKPQRLALVKKDLFGKIPADALVISIVAGAAIRGLQSGLDHRAVVRSMPNTPARIGEGITVWTAAPEVTTAQKALTEKILSALGEQVCVDDESYLDMATALSGTGPAYVFLFMEAMIDAGVHLGFPRRLAEQLVEQTVRGSADYYISRQEHAASLRNEVTSPGGTSAEALYYLEKAGFRTAISRAVWAAYERSQSLGAGREGQKPE